MLIVANWKTYLTLRQSENLAERIVALESGDRQLEIVLCPSLIALEEVAEEVVESKRRWLKVGAQDCFWMERGAYTGEVSPGELRGLGVTHVIVGHSERREHLGETDEMVRRKVHAVLAVGMTPILCVGETKAERVHGSAESKVRRQLLAALKGLGKAHRRELVVAYEPVWAVGTGEAVAPEEAERMHVLIQKVIGAPARILYGGSVDKKNITAFLRQRHVSGVLVGGASTKYSSLAALLRAAQSISSSVDI